MHIETPHADPGPTAAALARNVRRRVAALVLASTLAVALVFGLSFYFALVSNESAIARQVPELAGVAAQMRNLLLVNTLVFAGIIIASFYVLSRIVAGRFFRPLGAMQHALAGMAQGKLPHAIDLQERGAFAPVVDALRDAATRLRESDERDAADLRAIAAELDRVPAAAAAAKRLREMAERTAAAPRPREAEERKRAGKDPLFIQPV